MDVNQQLIPCMYMYRHVCVTPLTFSPVLVLQVSPSLLASTAAVTVVPLLPPQPTSITPSRGTCLSVRNVMWVVRGVTFFPHTEQSYHPIHKNMRQNVIKADHLP